MITKTHLKPKNIVLAIGLALSVNAQADLARMGPINPATTYPSYYQDNNGMALDLCMPNAAELIAGDCLLLPVDVPNPNAAISFPNNFPEEAFWFNANATTPLIGPDPVTGNAILVMALEAAFASGPVRVNDQIVFSRIRYKFIAPVAGSYTVETPYSSDTFTATEGELVFNTLDVGLSCPPGDFSCAMQGKTAPFLRASDIPGGAPLAPVVLPSGGTFLADPGIETQVTGGTVGNIFRITGPNGVIAETSQFFLMGRVHTAPLPRAVTVDRTTYARTAGGAQVDAFITSLSGIGAATPTFQLVGRELSGTALRQDPNAASKFHGQASANPAAIPTTVSIIDTTTAPASVITSSLTDLITVNTARYDSAAQTLTVQAVSSDEVGAPTLTVEGSNGRIYGPLTTNPTTFSGVTAAPASVIVTSSAGGKTSLPVSTSATAVANTTIAVNDTPLETELSSINVLANDTVPPPGPAVVRIIKRPEHGTVSVGTNNIVSYSVAGLYTGPDNFTYYIDNGANGLSNVASVDFNIATATGRNPIANPDTSSAPRGGSVTIDVLANDSDPDGTPLTLATVGTPTGNGTSASVVANKIVFTASSAATAGSTSTFTYTVNDGNGGSATGNVTVNILAPETITISRAQYSSRNRTWQINGALLPLPVPPITSGVPLKIYAGPVPAAGVAENPAQLIASITTIPGDLAGRFRFGATVSSVVPVNNQFHIVSSRGAVQTFAHTISR